MRPPCVMDVPVGVRVLMDADDVLTDDAVDLDRLDGPLDVSVFIVEGFRLVAAEIGDGLTGAVAGEAGRRYGGAVRVRVFQEAELPVAVGDVLGGEALHAPRVGNAIQQMPRCITEIRVVT